VSLEPANDEELLQLLYLCPVAILTLDGAGTIRLINPEGARLLLPVAPGGIVENLYDIFAVAAPELGALARAFPEPNGRICNEFRVLIGKTSGRRTNSRIFSVTLQKIDERAVIAVIADVTDAVTQEDETRATDTRLHAAFNEVKEYGMATLDLAGIVTSWNNAAEVMDGFTSSEIVGTSANVLMAPLGTERAGMKPLLVRARRDGWCERDGWRVRKDHSRYWANSAVTFLRGPGGDGDPLGYSMITRDLTEHKRTMDALRHLASTDSLTGTLSRRAFFETAIRAEKMPHGPGRQSAVLMLDLDFFKDVNDRHGHPAGDEALRAVSEAARGELRSVDAIGRYGGDEFVVLLRGCGAPAAARVAERIRARIEETIVDSGGTGIRMTVSIGVAVFDDAGGDIASTVAAADGALYEAKHAGRNRVVTSTHAA
jgi:diguanylate cyclase (GGDEF)-like protein/PAS domain S-box-containing protein